MRATWGRLTHEMSCRKSHGAYGHCKCVMQCRWNCGAHRSQRHCLISSSFARWENPNPHVWGAGGNTNSLRWADSKMNLRRGCATAQLVEVEYLEHVKIRMRHETQETSTDYSVHVNIHVNKCGASLGVCPALCMHQKKSLRINA